MTTAVESVQTAAPVWGTALVTAACPRCRAVFLVAGESAAGVCPACFAANLAPQPAPLRSEPPELHVPFAIGSAEAAAALETWARQVWLRPPGLAGPALAGRLVRVWLPMWLVDAEVRGSWQAQAGYDYDVASTQESYRDGQWVTQRLTETRIRWEPRAGTLGRAYTNVSGPALDDHARLTSGLGSFETAAGQPFAPDILIGAVVRVPSLEPEAAWPFARAAVEARAAADCQAAAGAQHIEGVKLSVTYGERQWTQLLLPVYATAYRDETGAWHPVLVHGQTGRVLGRLRASQSLGWLWTGGLAAAAVALLIVSLLISLVGAALPPLLALGGVLLLLAVALGLVAPVPAVWAWQFNRRA
jgi:hypothetical protein